MQGEGIMKSVNHNGKISSALDYVNDLAQEKKKEFQFNFNRIQKAVKNNAEKVQDTAMDLDRKAHKKPWLFIGAAAAGSLATGYLLGLFSRRK